MSQTPDSNDDDQDRRPWTDSVSLSWRCLPWYCWNQQQPVQEDQRIHELVRNLGTKKWSQVGESLPGRTGKQCRERYFPTCVSDQASLITLVPVMQVAQSPGPQH